LIIAFPAYEAGALSVRKVVEIEVAPGWCGGGLWWVCESWREDWEAKCVEQWDTEQGAGCRGCALVL